MRIGPPVRLSPAIMRTVRLACVVVVFAAVSAAGANLAMAAASVVPASGAGATVVPSWPDVAGGGAAADSVADRPAGTPFKIIKKAKGIPTPTMPAAPVGVPAPEAAGVGALVLAGPVRPCDGPGFIWQVRGPPASVCTEFRPDLAARA